MTAEIVIHSCPPRCDAGGTEIDGGHVFDREVEFFNCSECGNVWLEPLELVQARPFLGDICPKCFTTGGRNTGGSSACRCGMTAMDHSLMTMP